jgi:hypothetical protein
VLPMFEEGDADRNPWLAKTAVLQLHLYVFQ